MVLCVAGLAEVVTEVVVELAHRTENNEHGTGLWVSREFQFDRRGGAAAVSLLGSRPRPALQLRQAMALSAGLFVGDEVLLAAICACAVVEVGACRARRARLDSKKTSSTGSKG